MIKQKLLALAVAGALAVPQVGFAAEDSTGMRYDSASEGLYGSLRTIYRSKAGNTDDNNGVIEADSSRFGFKGTADMGGGLTGVYHYEQVIGGHNGEAPGNVRLNYVGLKGTFGEVNIGGTNNNIYSMAYSYADGSISGGGNYYGTGSRLTDAVTYSTPELNGFQGGAYMQFKGGSSKAVTAACLNADGTVNATAPTAPGAGAFADGQRCADGQTYRAAVSKSESLTRWGLGGKYGVRGFKVGGGYEVTPEGFTKAGNTEDKVEWQLAGQYAQDNWRVAVVYGQTNTTDNISSNSGNIPTGTNAPAACTQYAGTAGQANTAGAGPCEDQTTLAALGSIDIGKVGMRVELNNHSDYNGAPGMDRQLVSFGGEYRFTAQTKVYGAYIARDYDDDTTVADSVVIGMRVDF